MRQAVWGEQALTGHHLGPPRSLAALEEIFSVRGRAENASRVTVVLLDEMDLLLTKNQAVRSSGYRTLLLAVGGLAVAVDAAWTSLQCSSVKMSVSNIEINGW